jgi:8-oxo-dGTP pyrophosphatase MutT (NUDIX family)
MSVRNRTFLERIEQGLRTSLPGLAAQMRMAPDPHPRGQKSYLEAEPTCPKAGVLILLYEREGALFIPLTLRTDRLVHHRGQISLPGGEQHPGESLEATAVREAEEELGLDLSPALVLGRLTPLYIAPSNFCVYPIVAFFPGIPAIRPQPDEVAEVIVLPLDHVADPRHQQREMWTLSDRTASIPFFEFQGHKIWGATAMVLAEFLALLELPPA